MKKRQTRRKEFWEMTTAELRLATKEFEKGDGGAAVKPSAEALAQLRRSRQRHSSIRTFKN
jgi:hypothetical protein